MHSILGNTLVLCPKDHVKLFTQIPNEEPYILSSTHLGVGLAHLTSIEEKFNLVEELMVILKKSIPFCRQYLV